MPHHTVCLLSKNVRQLSDILFTLAPPCSGLPAPGSLLRAPCSGLPAPGSGLLETTHFLLHLRKDLTRFYKLLHFGVIFIQRPVDVKESYIFPDHILGFLNTLAEAVFFFPEVEGLCCRHKFNTENTIGIVKYLIVLDGCVHTH